MFSVHMYFKSAALKIRSNASMDIILDKVEWLSMFVYILI